MTHSGNDFPDAPKPTGRLLDARLHLLDRQLIDDAGEPVGIVDDLDLDGVAVGEDIARGTPAPRVSGILTGQVLGRRRSSRCEVGGPSGWVSALLIDPARRRLTDANSVQRPAESGADMTRVHRIHGDPDRHVRLVLRSLGRCAVRTLRAGGRSACALRRGVRHR